MPIIKSYQPEFDIRIMIFYFVKRIVLVILKH